MTTDTVLSIVMLAAVALLGGEASRVSDEDLARIEDLVRDARADDAARATGSKRR